MKRLFDVIISSVLLIVLSPILVGFLLIIWLQDRHNPLYIALRTGKNGVPFRMMKMRSMIVNADKSGVASTSVADKRITALGQTVRRFKLDELTQLWNVFWGDMSLVGPRPQIKRATDFYTNIEMNLLSVRPGITDFASIVFSDEGDILKKYVETPDIAYEQLIRPGKSMLGLFYIDNSSVLLDIKLCFLTAVAIVSRDIALMGLQRVLKKLEASDELLKIASRKEPLIPMPPPGANKIVTSLDERG
jgi:lipopolysaccharide/colanic/teichoic acid biosynthesis glycosyltransferase